MAPAELTRTVFEISREMEFFSEKELQMQIGHERSWWPLALVKELIDNALDACEAAGVAPEVGVTVDADGFAVGDNGSGIPPETLTRSLDYLLRVSDKHFYVSPTRGQMGNALKAVWAAPFVACGDYARIEVWARGLHHMIEVSVDRLAQRPTIEHVVEPSDFVKKGSLVRVHWPESASLLLDPPAELWPGAPSIPQVGTMVEDYAAFNPHARFTLNEASIEPTDLGWRKWRPGDPTSPHWYTPETMRDLIAAYVTAERTHGPSKKDTRQRTVRAFVSEFRGLSSTAKQKQVIGNLAGVYLEDLVHDGDVDMAVVRELLAAMQAACKAPQPAVLGVIGKAHLASWMARYAGVSEESVRYRKVQGEEDGLPYIVEVAFGVHENDDTRLRVVTGLNWASTLIIPVPKLHTILGEMRVDPHDPVTVAVHLARPRFNFVDRGKTRLQL